MNKEDIKVIEEYLKVREQCLKFENILEDLSDSADRQMYYAIFFGGF